MYTASLVLGILSLLGMFVGFIPCLGALNWLNIPLAILGLAVSTLAYLQKDGLPKKNAIIGLILSGVAVLFGGVRLMLGGGIL